MTQRQLVIIHSILNQVGGVLSPEDLGLMIKKREEFYENWNKFTERAINNLELLPENDKLFIFQSTHVINKKLIPGEAQTLTGYEDDERLDAIKSLQELLKVDVHTTISLEKKLPIELQGLQ